MTDYIIVNHDMVPSVVVVSFISFLLYGLVLWFVIELNKEYED